MTKKLKELEVNCFDSIERKFFPKRLQVQDKKIADILPLEEKTSSKLFFSPGFIDAHAHVYPGATNLGISPDKIGLLTGVHLVVDGGSAGSANYNCFRDYVQPSFKTPTKVFLNISRIGLITKQPYFDPRNIDVAECAACIREDTAKNILGIKVLSSGIIVEDAGLLPLQRAVKAAEITGCKIMAHLVEGPPSNAETMELLRSGDIITHCFHGKPNINASKKASKGADINPRYHSIDNILWNKDGKPTQPLEKALARGVFLDVGHGAASLDKNVAYAAIRAGVRQFSISTDAHIRNVDSVVHSLPHVMSKFMALGMSLEEVVASVTLIPARQLGLGAWCEQISTRGTLFQVRNVEDSDPQFFDAYLNNIEVTKLIEPVAVVVDGKISAINQKAEQLFG